MNRKERERERKLTSLILTGLMLSNGMFLTPMAEAGSTYNVTSSSRDGLKDGTDFQPTSYDLASNTSIWGQGNPEALIFVPNIYLDVADYKVIGTNKDTVRFEKNGIIYIKFHASDLIEQLKKCNEIKISIVGKPNINEWMGQHSP